MKDQESMSPRNPEENERIRAERRQQILEAALELFAEKGYFNTKISDIAERLGVGKGTIYWYFDSKEDLFETVFRYKFEAMAKPLFAIASDTALTPGDKLYAIAENAISLFYDETELMFIMLQAMSTPEVAELLTHDFKEYYDRFADMLEPLFSALGEADPLAAASLYAAALDGAMLQYVVGTRMFDKEHLMAQIREKFNL